MIICIVGPTASGKSKVAEELSLFYNAKIVNFDAFQVYKEMDIGTAKPTKEELESGRYFLYDFKNIDEDFDVFKYQEICRKFLKEYKNENLILVGGTGLYLKAALYDYNFEKDESPMPSDFLCEYTNEDLYEKLLMIDPIDANKIGINNRKRLLRALYIYKIHGKSKSSLNQNGKNKLLYEDVHIIGLDIPREILYERINQRVDEMIDSGLEKEVEFLFYEHGADKRALQAIGYKEFNNELPFDEKVELIKKNTRNYAKRQMTFFKHQFDNINWFTSVEEAIDYGKTIR